MTTDDDLRNVTNVCQLVLPKQPTQNKNKTFHVSDSDLSLCYHGITNDNDTSNDASTFLTTKKNIHFSQKTQIQILYF